MTDQQALFNQVAAAVEVMVARIEAIGHRQALRFDGYCWERTSDGWGLWVVRDDAEASLIQKASITEKVEALANYEKIAHALTSARDVIQTRCRAALESFAPYMPPVVEPVTLAGGGA